MTPHENNLSANADAKRTIAILGAKGRVGNAVAKAFHHAGWKVRAVTRTGICPGLDGLEGVEFAAADAMKHDELVAAVQGANVIFNGLHPPYTDWKAKAVPMARNVIAAAKASGASHLFPGNVYNFGSSLPAELKEDTPFDGDHSKARIRIEMENLFAEAASRDGVKTVILRAGDFYGTENGGSWFDQVLAKDIAKGRFTWPGRRDIDHAWAYLPDLAAAFVAIAGKLDETRAFDVYHFAGHTLTGARMHEAAEKAMGRPLKKGWFPRFALPVAALFNPMMREINAMMYLWDRPHRLDETRLSILLGHAPKVTPVDDAVAAALEDLGHRADAGGAKHGATDAALA